ncbi:OB domain-containing protein [Entamoeba marina]
MAYSSTYATGTVQENNSYIKASPKKKQHQKIKEFLYNEKVIGHAVVCGEIVHMSQEAEVIKYILDDSTGLITVTFYEPESEEPTLAEGDYMKAIGKIKRYSDGISVFALCRNKVSIDEYFVHMLECAHAYIK